VKSRKAIAFFTTLAALMVIYVITALCAPEAIPAIGPTVIVMIVGNAATYIGGNVFYAFQRSKYYRAELDEQNGGGE